MAQYPLSQEFNIAQPDLAAYRNGVSPWLKVKHTQNILPLFIQGLDASKLQLVSLKGSETLSRFTPWTLVFDYPDADINVKELARAKVGVLYDMQGNSSKEDYTKAYTGIVWNISRAQGYWVNPQDDYKKYYRYQAQIVPKLFFLDFHVDNRVWVNQTPVDIIKSILSTEHKIDDDFDIQVTGIGNKYKIPFSIQYAESDWAFLQRILMKYGIYFYIQHKCSAKGEITHKVIFTDKTPAQIAKTPSATTLAKPQYCGLYQNDPTGSWEQDWVGLTAWRAFSYPMMSQVAMSGYDPKNPATLSMRDQKLNAMGNQVTEHPTFGHFYIQQATNNTASEGQGIGDTVSDLAQVRVNQYNAFQQQVQATANVPAYNVFDTFEVADKKKQQFENNAFGVDASKYLIYEVSFDINLLAKQSEHYLPPYFRITAIPLTNSTPAPSPYYNLPAEPVKGAKLFCTVCDADGKFDGDAIKNANRVSTQDNLRNPYVCFPDWDNSKRTQEKENPAACPTLEFTHSGLKTMPMVGAKALVEATGWDQMLLFLGVQHHTNYEPYEGEMKQTGEMVLMAQPVNGKDQPNVSRIVFGDGAKPDEKRQEQKLEVYTPSEFDLTAATADEAAHAKFSIDKDGNITLGNTKDKFENQPCIKITKDGEIEIQDAFGNSIAMTKDGIAIASQKGKFSVNSEAEMNLATKANFAVSAESGMSLESKAVLALKAQEASIKTQGPVTIESLDLTVDAKGTLMLETKSMGTVKAAAMLVLDAPMVNSK
jgi:hypothetical protein